MPVASSAWQKTLRKLTDSLRRRKVSPCAKSGREQPHKWAARRTGLLDDLVGACKQRWRHGEAERLSSFAVDDEFEFGRLLDWEFPRRRSLEYLVNVRGSAAVQVGRIRTIGHQAAGLYKLTCTGNERQPILTSQLCDLCSISREQGVVSYEDRVRPFCHLKHCFELLGIAHSYDLQLDSQGPSCCLGLLHISGTSLIGRAHHNSDPREAGKQLFEQLQLLPRNVCLGVGQPSDVATRVGEAGDQPGGHWINGCDKNHRDRPCDVLGC